jgi:hypothetical protein
MRLEAHRSPGTISGRERANGAASSVMACVEQGCCCERQRSSMVDVKLLGTSRIGGKLAPVVSRRRKDRGLYPLREVGRFWRAR